MKQYTAIVFIKHSKIPITYRKITASPVGEERFRKFLNKKWPNEISHVNLYSKKTKQFVKRLKL